MLKTINGSRQTVKALGESDSRVVEFLVVGGESETDFKFRSDNFLTPLTAPLNNTHQKTHSRG